MLENLKEQKGRLIFSIVFGIVIIIANNITHGVWNSYINYIDGLFIAGFSLICIGGLSVCGYFGIFDIFSHMGAKRNHNGVKPTLYEYSQMRAEKRKTKPLPFIPYFTVGLFYVLLMIIIYFIFLV